MEMVNAPTFQNIAAKMLTGHDAYDGTTNICLEKLQGPSEDPRTCEEDLKPVIQGACSLNIVVMWYVRHFTTSVYRVYPYQYCMSMGRVK